MEGMLYGLNNIVEAAGKNDGSIEGSRACPSAFDCGRRRRWYQPKHYDGGPTSIDVRAPISSCTLRTTWLNAAQAGLSEKLSKKFSP